MSHKCDASVAFLFSRFVISSSASHHHFFLAAPVFDHRDRDPYVSSPMSANLLTPACIFPVLLNYNAIIFISYFLCSIADPVVLWFIHGDDRFSWFTGGPVDARKLQKAEVVMPASWVCSIYTSSHALGYTLAFRQMCPAFCVQCSALQYITVQHDTKKCNAIQCKCNVVWWKCNVM